MKILMINKFLYPKGGSETYIFKLGEYLQSQGHEVEYFGMDHPDRCVGNCVNAYTSDMDFHGGSKLAKLTYPIKTIYNREARTQIRKVLEAFRPDACHINNFNYQLTPSIILEIKKWNPACKVIYTAHDGQLVCPNHMFKNPNTGEICEKCIDGQFVNCLKGKCIHGATAKSAIGMMESVFWKWKKVYRLIDTIICPSEFMKSKLDHCSEIAGRTVALHNFVDAVEKKQTQKKDYVLYFGRYSEEKGIRTLIETAKELPEIPFVFAGSGPLADQLKGIPNVQDVGFKMGSELETLIREARFSICPSECYENCPFSIMESQMYGTPVIGADIGGIPELIDVGKTGELFESGNAEQLKDRILSMWQDPEKLNEYTQQCRNKAFVSQQQYYESIMEIY